MIVILDELVTESSEAFASIMRALSTLKGVTPQYHQVSGEQRQLLEIHLLGDTQSLDPTEIRAIAGVQAVVRVSASYRRIGRHSSSLLPAQGFTYKGVKFSQDDFVPCIGLCAVDNPENVEAVMKAVSEAGLKCTRMGAYKPRTNPYAFQGHGRACLHYVFESAARHDIRVVAMEVTAERHIDEIQEVLNEMGDPCGVMLQIGTRNTQNFELLKSAGSQTEHPILIKRGFGITLEETLNATEYLAASGNEKIVLCLRGVKTHYAAPHRNLVEFVQVPVVKRLTRLPVCVDPSHSVGIGDTDPDGIPDVWHATAQGVIAGANMVLTDVHPQPSSALVDAAQAVPLDHLGAYCEDLRLCRESYLKRRALRAKLSHAGAHAGRVSS